MVALKFVSSFLFLVESEQCDFDNVTLSLQMSTVCQT